MRYFEGWGEMTQTSGGGGGRFSWMREVWRMKQHAVSRELLRHNVQYKD